MMLDSHGETPAHPVPPVVVGEALVDVAVVVGVVPTGDVVAGEVVDGDGGSDVGAVPLDPPVSAALAA